jgi:hypothetical protein
MGGLAETLRLAIEAGAITKCPPDKLYKIVLKNVREPANRKQG